MSQPETKNNFSQQYEELIRSFCALCDMPEQTEAILGGEPLTVNEVVFSLSHNAEISPHVVLVYCDFGPVIEGREAEAYRALLETNLMLYPSNGPMYTVSPLTSRVIFASNYPLQTLDARHLRNSLARLAGMAKEWSKTQFLQDPPIRSKGQASGNLLQRQFEEIACRDKPEEDTPS